MKQRNRKPAYQRRAHAEKSGILIRWAIVCVSLALCVCVGAGVILHMQAAKSDALPTIPQPPPESASVAPPQPVVTTLHFSASGDDLIHDGLYLQAKKRGGDVYDFTALYENVADFYKSFDINWINQETLVSDEIAPSGYPTFCSPTAVAQTLYNIGFRVFALSNNHSYDKGATGLASTLNFWRSMPQDTVFTGLYAGEADYDNITIQEVNGVKIAYLPYTELTNGIPTPQDAVANIIYTSDLAVIERQIKLARTLADVVIPCVHMGTENSHEVNDAQRTLGQQMADWGADIIIGTHPHVVQPVEYFTAAESGKSVPMFMSLGNFVSTQNQIDNLIGVVATFDITKTTMPDGVSQTVIDNLHAVPIVMHYDANYKNARVYLLRDYTDELAAQHGNPNMSLTYIHTMLAENMNAELLSLS
ncbi:MAG: CapA family protein [Ruthenibacterium sp.]